MFIDVISEKRSEFYFHSVNNDGDDTVIIFVVTDEIYSSHLLIVGVAVGDLVAVGEDVDASPNRQTFSYTCPASSSRHPGVCKREASCTLFARTSSCWKPEWPAVGP